MMPVKVLFVVLFAFGSFGAVAAPSAEQRLRDIDAVKVGKLRLRPTFVCCGVSYGVGAERAVDFQYRKVGTAGWKQAPKPPYFKETLDCRGSIFGLDEDSDYEVRVLVDRIVAKEGRFRTWASEVPVAKTVVLDPKKVRFPIRLRDRGTSEGWIRYTVKKGEVIDNPTGSACFIFEGARNVLLDDVVMRGCGSSFSVIVTNSVQVRIRNCDISRWGRVGTPDYSRHGMRFNETLPPTREWGINFDGAVVIGERASEVVVERCWIHDPNGEANSWRYFHPAGPEAIFMRRPDHSTVIRWCDFTGSDEHRWNDAVESGGNFDELGGFNRDADVYGNFMNLCNDDCIELDGGQQNVRCFGNRFETALVGVSVQGNMVSPSYVLDNLFSGMGERFGECGQTIKTSGYDWAHSGPWCLVEGNVLWGGGSGLALDGVWQLGRYVVRNNVFCGGQKMSGRPGPSCLSNLVEEGNVFEAEIAEEALDVSYPKRPLPFTLDRARVSGIRFGAESPKPLTVTATSTAARPISFVIAKNEVFDWFDVTPSSGEIPAGGRLAFTVTPRREKLDGRRFWRGAFLVRTPEGLSRPFSFELENASFVEPFRCEKDGEFAAYAEVGQPFALTAERTFAFEAPKDGRYFFLVRAVAAQNAPYEVSVDGAPWTVSHVQGFANVANWSLVNLDCQLWGGRFRFFDLKAGRHTLGIRPLAKATRLDTPSPVRIEGAVLTDSPGSFEPR